MYASNDPKITVPIIGIKKHKKQRKNVQVP